MQQTELNKLLAAPYAEFDRRLREARLRVRLAGIEGFRARPAEIELQPEAEAEIA